MQEQIAIIQFKNGQKKIGRIIINETLDQLIFTPFKSINKLIDDAEIQNVLIKKDDIHEIDLCLK